MKTFNFTSSLADEMAHFVKLKQLSGSDYAAQAKLLRYFDRYLASQGFDGKELTESQYQDYFSTINYIHSRTFSNRYGIVRQFSIWLNRGDHRSYILERHRAVDRSHSRPVYVFSHDEIKAILLESSTLSLREERITGLYRTLFSLLYSTGIRIGEALALNCADYTRDEKLIHIQKGKFHKERYLILSSTMAECLNNYLLHHEVMTKQRGTSPLFFNIRDNRLRLHNVHWAFKKVLKKSGIHKDKNNGPRIHSFRHTFAVHRLLRWYETEKDINSKLPFLATYMGHVNINSTQVYLQASNELLKVGCERFQHFFINNCQ